MKGDFEALVKIAREWGEYTYPDGRNHKKYCDDFVNCYHADNSDHMSITLGGIEVAMFSPPKLSGSIHNLTHAGRIAAKSKDLLDNLRVERAAKSLEEKDKERVDRIASLKLQLSELGEPA